MKELYVVATRKMQVVSVVVKHILRNFRNMEIVGNDLDLIEQALEISVVSRLFFWDSLIIAAAEKVNCEYIYSEVLNSGQVYRGVTPVNPFENPEL